MGKKKEGGGKKNGDRFLDLASSFSFLNQFADDLEPFT